MPIIAWPAAGGYNVAVSAAILPAFKVVSSHLALALPAGPLLLRTSGSSLRPP
jgi:hypothetical protein